MLNKLLEKFLPCQKMINILVDQHAQASEMNNNAHNRIKAACDKAMGKNKLICIVKGNQK